MHRATTAAAAPPQERHVAEVVQLRGCFGAKKGSRPVLPVLDAAAAAAWAQETREALLWLDLEAETLHVTQWWGFEALKHALPTRISVEPVSRPYRVEEELTVATLEFLDRESAELVLRLAHLLPQWDAIRHDADGMNLLVHNDHWLLSYDKQALLMRTLDGDCSGRLSLDVLEGRLELAVLGGGHAIRTCPVGCLLEAARLLSKHTKPKLRLDKAVHGALRDLKPSRACMQQLLSKLQSSCSSSKGSTSMAQWCRGGILAALTDCATCMVDSTTEQQQQQPGRLSLSGHSQQHHWQFKRVTVERAARAEVLHSLAECCALVLQQAPELQQQARLLVACVKKALAASPAQAAAALQLFMLVLHHTSAPHVYTTLLQEAAADFLLLEALRHCCDTTLAPEGAWLPGGQQQPTPRHEILEPGCDEAGGGVGGRPGVTGSSSERQRTPARAGHVPRLTLPSTGSGMLSPARTAAAAARSEVAGADAAGGQAELTTPAKASALKALQQLGQACGQSVMAAEVAAFVTHKQLHSNTPAGGRAVAAGPATPVNTSASGGGNMEDDAGGLSVEQVCCSLPLGVQLQLLVLECLTLLLPHLQPGANLAPSLYHQLLGQVLEHSRLSGSSPVAGGTVLELACRRMRSAALQVLSHCTAVARRAAGVARPPASDVLHSCLLERFKLALTDCSNSQRSGDGRHTACADVLCLLGDYLRACDQPQLADTACFMLGPALVQQEHQLRAVRMELWSWAAMQHMDGLVRVYAALMAQATSPAAMAWLLKALGVAGSSGGSAGGVPADTLQLVLDYLLKHLTRVAAAITHSFGGAAEQAAAAWGSSGGGSLKQQDGGMLSPATPSSARSAVRMAGHMLAAAGLDLQSNAASTHVTQMKAHCWQLLAALLQLAVRGAGMMRTAGVPGTTSGAVLSPSLWRGLTGGSEGAAPGCCRVWQLLVDLLMMHSKAGQAVVLQQLGDTNGGRLLLPLQHALFDFLAVALGAPDAYPCTRPQLAEFFVHHHFLHFTQHYHKLPTSPTLAAANCCKGHAKVLLALCHQTGGANLVRRRFLQLKVLEFLTREASVEYMLQHKQLLPSPSSSCCSTPLASSRVLDSSRTPGWEDGSAAAAAPRSLSLALPAAAAAGGGSGSSPAAAALHGRQLSARGAASRLSVSSPGCVPATARRSLGPRGTPGYGGSAGGAPPAHPANALLVCGLEAKPRAHPSVAAGAAAEPATAADAGSVVHPHPGSVKSAVQAFEAAAAAASPQPAARRQPGGARLDLAGSGTAAGVRAAGLITSVAGSDGDRPPRASSTRSGGGAAVAAADGGSSKQVVPQPPGASKPHGSGSRSAAGQHAHRRHKVPQLMVPSSSSSVAAAALSPAAGSQGGAGGASALEGCCALPQPQSPRAALGLEVPASMLSQRRVQPPKLTGDSSLDCQLIEAWEEQTGLEFTFEGLSDGSSSSSPTTPAPAAGSSEGASPTAGGSPGSKQQPTAASAVAPVSPLSPRLSATPGDWLSKPAGACGAAAAAKVPRLWSAAGELLAEEAPTVLSGSPCSGQRQPAKPSSTAVTRLQLGGLGSAQPPPAAAAASPASPASSCAGLSSPGSGYKVGWDLEEDFERMMSREARGSDDCWDFSSEGGDDAAASSPGGSPGSHHSAQPRSSSPPRRRLVPGLKLAVAEPPPPERQQQQRSPECPVQGDTRGDTDTPAARWRSPPGKLQPSPGSNAKRQSVIGTGGCQAVPSPVAFALLDEDWGTSEGDSRDEADSCCGEQEEAGSSRSSGESDTAEELRSPAWTHVVPKLKLPHMQQQALHLPMSAAAAGTPNSTGGGSSRFGGTACSTPRSHADASLLVTPLATARGFSHGGGATARVSSSSSAAGAAFTARSLPSARGVLDSTRGLAAAAAVTPVPFQGECQLLGGTADGLDPLQACYRGHIRKRALYLDAELHAMCLELALHLLVTPAGTLDAVQLPQEPSDTALQRKALMLLEHLSHSHNLSTVGSLTQRARAALQALEGGSASSSSSALPLPAGEVQRAVATLAAAAAVNDAGSDSARPQHAPAALTAQGAAAGLGCCTLRLLKLLSVAAFDDSLSVGSMLSKGAFSEVMAGTWQPAGGDSAAPVAIKVLDCSEDDASCFERVYSEVTVLEVLQGQPGIIPLLEYGVTSRISDQRQWLLVFPRYGGSLREWRQRWRRRGLTCSDLRVYLRLFLQVARAVAVLHATRVVHFDIKGDNLLLPEGFSPDSSSSSSSSGHDSGIVLADFGDAVMLADAHAASQRHRGTELFSSPEMLLLHAGKQHARHAQHDRRKHRGVQAAHDVWSLGCTLYELLTGTVLFEEEGVGRIASYYGSSPSSGGGACGGGGVLNAQERAALGHHGGCIELIEAMLVGEPNWRPGADQVVLRTQRLLESL